MIFSSYSLVLHVIFSSYSLVLHVIFSSYSLVVHMIFSSYSLVLHVIFSSYSLVLHMIFSSYSLVVHLVISALFVYSLLGYIHQPFLFAPNIRPYNAHMNVPDQISVVSASFCIMEMISSTHQKFPGRGVP